MLAFFNKLNLIRTELDATWKSSEIISHNIANADTPNFKARRLEFKSALESEMKNVTVHNMKTTNEKHMSGEAIAKPKISVDYSSSMRLDGNNVDVENEMVQLAGNNIKYSFLIQKASKEISKLRYAINEGKR